MKKRWLSLLPVLCMMLWVAPVTALADAGDIAINETNFPDEKFRGIVKEKYDKDKSGSLNLSERESATWIQCSDKGIGSLKGIEYFSKLDKLECNNNNLTMLDLSENTQLTKLQCQKNQLTSLDLRANTKLQELRCRNNKLESLDVSQNDLQFLSCSNNQLTSLNLNNHISLKDVDCSNNKLTTLEIGTKNYLMRISCQKNNLASLDVNNVPELQYLYCYSNSLTELDVRKNSKLKELECQSNQLESLDVSMNTQLERLQCYNNHLTSLDISNCAVINDEDFKGDSNTYSITFDANMEFDLNTLPGNFDVAKSTNWEKGKVDGTTLKPNGGNPGAVGYSYDCGQEKTVHFHLNVSYTHTHAYDGTWKQDESKHWKECTDSSCPDKNGSVTDSAAHVYDDDADTDCNICGYVRTVTVPHTHTYGAWTHDTSKHWKECTDSSCPDKNGSVKDSAVHVYDNDADIDCNVCGYTRTIAPPHSCAGSLVMVGAKAATCTADGNKEYYRCGTCGKLYEDNSGTVAITDPTTVVIPKTGHSASADYKNDADKHWKECTVCKVRIGETAHTYDSNGTCTTCGYKKPSSGGSSGGGSSSGGSSSGGSSGGGSSSGGSSGGHHSSSGGGGGSSRRSGSGSSTTSKTLAGSWKQNQNGWWYQYTNGTWPSNSWVKLPVQGGETWYYFNKDGYMATGWLFENNIWYYLDPQAGTNNGRMMTGWQQIGGQWYYFNQNGSMATGWNYINNNWYFLDHQAGGNNGRMFTGWHMISDKWYYFSTDKLAGEGSMYADRMTPDGFYVNKDGVWVQ